MSSNRLMTSADVARLPLKQVEAALRKTTEVLATELAAPTGTTPDWTDFEWCIARAVAAMHGVSPLLSGTLRWRGPDRWECFLSEQRDHTLQRHRRIAQLLANIGSHAVSNGIAIVPLKGAALHDIGIYQPGERPMSDIDLLVKSADLQATARLLGACGYHESFASWKHRVFEPDATTNPIGYGEHTHNPIKIDLHSRVAERILVVDQDISAAVFPSQPLAGLNSYSSIASLMAHLLLHAAGNMCCNGIRLLHLHDIALLSRRLTQRDWERVFPATGGTTSWCAAPPLMLTARYYSTAVPAHIVTRAEAACSWLLRQTCRRQTLSDVSFSNLWIQAFPGIEWSRSTRDIFRYVIRRVKPDRETVVVRKEVVRLHPGSAHFSWPHLSQGRRILHWVLHRPPRMETLSSIRGALAHLTQPP